AHVGRLAADVRAGGEQELARAREARVVGDEVLDLALHDEVAALGDVDAVLGGELRAREAEGFGTGAERGGRGEPRGRVRHALERLEVRVELLDEGLEELPLEAE